VEIFCYIDCATFFEKNLDNSIFLLAILEMENVKFGENLPNFISREQ
jgi:hypothetical protein